MPTRIFLVEDNRGDVRLIEELLRLRGIDYQLSTYEAADVAIRRLYRCGKDGGEIPDLIILDFNVPRGDARDMLVAISKNPALGSTPIMVLSSSVSPSDQKQSLALGADCFVTKPLTLDTFLFDVGAAIAKLLSR